MPAPRNSNQLFHAWAHQTRKSAQCGNVRFNGPVLYSYATGIARVCTGKAGQRFYLFADSNYSSSTSRQMFGARRACDGAIFEARAPSRGSTLDDIPQLESYAGEYYLSRIEEHLKDATRCRKAETLGWCIKLAIEERDRFVRLQDFIDIKGFESHLKAMNDLLAQYEGPDMAENIKRLKEGLAEQEKRRIAEQEHKLREAVEIWREGLGSYPRLDYAVLRIREALGKLVVETSSSASVPFFHAVKMLFFYRIDPKLVVGRQIGVYTLHSDANGILKIGCHQIRFSEVEATLGMAIDDPGHFFDRLPVRLDADGQYAERLVRLITKLNSRSNNTIDEEE